ncbi:monooxygenase [Flagelloscypha sp. PMI_526]|nr:monooxygenase [Flagelloscypha sp. PMI_526]
MRFQNARLALTQIVRKEWRSLSADEQSEYIRAVTCLTQAPSKMDASANSTVLYDNFPEMHAVLNLQIHHVAMFLPWHRYYVHLYEKALIEDCGYTGHAIYWDWTLDANNLAGAPIWESFGGNGASDTHCVTDGPFASLEVRNPDPHCLQRNFGVPTVTPNNATVTATFSDLAAPFSKFTFDLENGAHASVHLSVGGDMVPEWSPNDPVFFLHHGNIDRIWWMFQQSSPSRATEFNGSRKPYNPFDPVGDPASIDDLLPMYAGFASEVAISEVMQTQGGLDGELCYTY